MKTLSFTLALLMLASTGLAGEIVHRYGNAQSRVLYNSIDTSSARAGIDALGTVQFTNKIKRITTATLQDPKWASCVDIETHDLVCVKDARKNASCAIVFTTEKSCIDDR